MTLDRHRLGVEVSERLEAIGTRGGVTPGLWALGPIVRGVFWECTAVPDIRRQAAEVADIVANSGPRSRRGPATSALRHGAPSKRRPAVLPLCDELSPEEAVDQAAIETMSVRMILRNSFTRISRRTIQRPSIGR